MNVKRGAVREAHQQTIVLHGEITRSNHTYLGSGHSRMKLQDLSAKLCKCARPGLKSAQAVPGIRRRVREVDEPIFAFEDRRERCLGIVLRPGSGAGVLECG